MKTRILISAAIFALSMFTLTSQAQNIKSVNYASYTPQKSAMEEHNAITIIREELKQYLKQFAAFNDEIKMDDTRETEYWTEDVKSELMKTVKFNPAETIGFDKVETEMDMDDIISELMKSARYYPSVNNDLVNNPEMANMQEIMAELEVYARYKPTTIQ